MVRKMMKFETGEVVKHKSAEDSVGLIIEVMPAYPAEDSVIRDISGNSYQVYWSIHPPGDNDLDECWYPEEHIERINKR